MTFYWWSHWFWITLLSSILCHTTLVQTYPSQEISLEYNQNIKPLKTVTKLYQATTLTWATAVTPLSRLGGATAEKTVLQKSAASDLASVEDELLRNETEADGLAATIDDGDGDGDGDGDVEGDHIDVEKPIPAAIEDEDFSDDYEFKRSAENYGNKSNDVEIAVGSGAGEAQTPEEPQVAAVLAPKPQSQSSASEHGAASTAAAADATPEKLKREQSEMNNYTNFSGSANSLSTNPNTNQPTGPQTPQVHAKSATEGAAPAANATVDAAATPEAPPIDSAQSTVEWLKGANGVNISSSEVEVNASITAAAIAFGSASSQKVPFTLENVNKEDELRRAENEHRSRKSKVLSAEYKHINRFINYSTDSKSLLTRSASTAPNDFDGDESNISSEALAIQRTYFLDAGAISAICFTVFGVCCTVGTIGIVLYRRRYLNKPQALSEPDSSVYIDDSTMRVSDNSDEMYSLDNDSFLNSLEAMTIQNYWTDTVKHTKL